MYHTIIEQVVDAKLSRSVESLVLRLLHVVDGKTGQVALLMDDFLHLTGVRTKGAAVRYLSHLKQAGIIRYHTHMDRIDAQVFVTFRAWKVEGEGRIEAEDKVEEMSLLRGELAILRGQMDEVLRVLGDCCGVESARKGCERGVMSALFSAGERAVLAQPRDQDLNQPINQSIEPFKEVGLLVGQDLEIQEPTNQQTRPVRAESSIVAAEAEVKIEAFGRRETTTSSSTVTSISTDEQERIYKLLTDPAVGVSERKARGIAQIHRFDYVRRQTFAWQAEMKIGKVEGAGALVHRINARFGATEPTAEQQESALYQRHRTPFEIEAEVKAQEEVEAMGTARKPMPPQPKSQPQPIDPTLWPQVMAQLKAEFPTATYEVYLQSAQLLGIEDGVYRIGMANNFLRDNADRYRGIIRRKLGALVGNSQVPIRIETSESTLPRL